MHTSFDVSKSTLNPNVPPFICKTILNNKQGIINKSGSESNVEKSLKRLDESITEQKNCLKNNNDTTGKNNTEIYLASEKLSFGNKQSHTIINNDEESNVEQRQADPIKSKAHTTVKEVNDVKEDQSVLAELEKGIGVQNKKKSKNKSKPTQNAECEQQRVDKNKDTPDAMNSRSPLREGNKKCKQTPEDGCEIDAEKGKNEQSHAAKSKEPILIKKEVSGLEDKQNLKAESKETAKSKVKSHMNLLVEKSTNTIFEENKVNSIQGRKQELNGQTKEIAVCENKADEQNKESLADKYQKQTSVNAEGDSDKKLKNNLCVKCKQCPVAESNELLGEKPKETSLLKKNTATVESRQLPNAKIDVITRPRGAETQTVRRWQERQDNMQTTRYGKQKSQLVQDSWFFSSNEHFS